MNRFLDPQGHKFLSFPLPISLLFSAVCLADRMHSVNICGVNKGHIRGVPRPDLFLSHPWRTYPGRLQIPRQQTPLSSPHSWAGVSAPRAGAGCLQQEVRRGPGARRGRRSRLVGKAGAGLCGVQASRQCPVALDWNKRLRLLLCSDNIWVGLPTPPFPPPHLSLKQPQLCFEQSITLSQTQLWALFICIREKCSAVGQC